MTRIVYVELPAARLNETASFYRGAFGLDLHAFGPSYAATTSGEVDMGLQGDAAEATAAPLAVIAVDDLEQALADVVAVGAAITRPIFAFPGGRRFHFRDPSGNELAALVADPATG